MWFHYLLTQSLYHHERQHWIECIQITNQCSTCQCKYYKGNARLLSLYNLHPAVSTRRIVYTCSATLPLFLPRLVLPRVPVPHYRNYMRSRPVNGAFTILYAQIKDNWLTCLFDQTWICQSRKWWFFQRLSWYLGLFTMQYYNYWVLPLLGTTKEPLLIGWNGVSGSPSVQSAYRSELAGIIAGIITAVKLICSW
jgi:hypothetical protein